jgi:ubiquinone/menaquinone biosynthesis C-methylase UbiE
MDDESHNKSLQEVHDFWEKFACGEIYADGESSFEKYRNETLARYRLEPYIQEFADFPSFKDLDVLEIGVGMGSDHSSIAAQNPKSLSGVDLTSRSIEKTQERFDLFQLQSRLSVDNAENLSFEDNSFDAVYSWGTLHHSPDTPQCFKETHRVLRPGGFAKIMIYYKYSSTGLILWLRYGLLAFRPFRSLEEIFSNHLESPGTKAYSFAEARKLTQDFAEIDMKVQVCHADTFEGEVGARHKGPLLKIAKTFFPKSLVRFLGRFLPIGLFLLITVKK